MSQMNREEALEAFKIWQNKKDKIAKFITSLN